MQHQYGLVDVLDRFVRHTLRKSLLKPEAAVLPLVGAKRGKELPLGVARPAGREGGNNSSLHSQFFLSRTSLTGTPRLNARAAARPAASPI